MSDRIAGQHLFLCDGCNVRGPHEHKCWGLDGPSAEPLCECDDVMCMQRQGREVDMGAVYAELGIERP